MLIVSSINCVCQSANWISSASISESVVAFLIPGKGGNAGRSLYPNHVSDTKMGSNQEQRVHPQEQAMEVGFEDSAAPQTLERLDRSFHNDIMKLMKEQDDAEDSENARHREVSLLSQIGSLCTLAAEIHLSIYQTAACQSLFLS